jgi:hypothetical protein
MTLNHSWLFKFDLNKIHMIPLLVFNSPSEEIVRVIRIASFWAGKCVPDFNLQIPFEYVESNLNYSKRLTYPLATTRLYSQCFVHPQEISSFLSSTIFSQMWHHLASSFFIKSFRFLLKCPEIVSIWYINFFLFFELYLFHWSLCLHHFRKSFISTYCPDAIINRKV